MGISGGRPRPTRVSTAARGPRIGARGRVCAPGADYLLQHNRRRDQPYLWAGTPALDLRAHGVGGAARRPETNSRPADPLRYFRAGDAAAVSGQQAIFAGGNDSADSAG